MNEALLGVSVMVTFLVTPMVLFKAYLSDKENKQLRKKLGR